MRRAWVGFLTLLCLAVGEVPASRAQQASPSEDEKVGAGVLETLLEEGEADVVIALSQSQTAGATGVGMADLRLEIAAMQNAVLSELYSADYRPRHTYQAVPALAGKVMSKAGLGKLAAHPQVVKIDLDVGGSGVLANSVPLIKADLRHLFGNTGSGVVVAVLDSGLDTDHDDLADSLVREECFLDNNGAIDGNGLCPNGSDRQSGAGAAEDDAGHGTHVTGTITSNGTQSSVGVAPDADIVAIKVTAGPTFGGVFPFFSEIVAALDFIINNPQLGIDVINMSLGTFAQFTGDCDNSTAFNMAGAAAINTLRANGVTAFAAAGNNSSGTQMISPACLSNVVSVGATDNLDNVAGFSNSNASTDIFAPGVSVVSDARSNGTTTASGTSMASAHAAGCAALLIEAGDAISPAQIEARLEISPVTVVDPTNGRSFPRIDCAPEPTPTDTPTGTPTETPTATPTVTPTATPTETPVPLGRECSMTSQCSGEATCIEGVCTGETAVAPASSNAALLISIALLAALGGFAIQRRRRALPR